MWGSNLTFRRACETVTTLEGVAMCTLYHQDGTRSVAGLMTPADISEAQRLARQWLETHQ
jgi:hypothetical protein